MNIAHNERAAGHFLAILVVLVILGGVFFAISLTSQVPVLLEKQSVLERRIDTMQEKIDDLDTRIKILQLVTPSQGQN